MKLRISTSVVVASADELKAIPVDALSADEFRFLNGCFYKFHIDRYFGDFQSDDCSQADPPQRGGCWIKDNRNAKGLIDVVEEDHVFQAGEQDITSEDNKVLFREISNAPLELNDFKQIKFDEINNRTGELIRNGGHVYNGKTFSLRETAQLNILGAEAKKDIVGLFPLIFTTIDDFDEISLENSTDVDDFFMTALLSKKSHLDSGTTLKRTVRNAATKAEIDAVIDNRS